MSTGRINKRPTKAATHKNVRKTHGYFDVGHRPARWRG